MRLSIATLGCALCLAIAIGASADSREMPRFDPFVPALGAGGGARGAVWSPELRSTLVGTDNSVANLGGEILRIGDETHGYTLLEVRRSEAVFSKDGQPIVLKLVEKSQP